jgi:hypothetical protein
MVAARKAPTCSACHDLGHTARGCPRERAKLDKAREEAAEERRRKAWEAESERKRDFAAKKAEQLRYRLIERITSDDLGAEVVTPLTGVGTEEESEFVADVPTVVGRVRVTVDIIAHVYLDVTFEFETADKLELWIDAGNPTTGTTVENKIHWHLYDPSAYQGALIDGTIFQLTDGADLARQKRQGHVMLARMLDVDDERPDLAVLALHELKLEKEAFKRKFEVMQSKLDDLQCDLDDLKKEKDASDAQCSKLEDALNVTSALIPDPFAPCPSCGKVGYHDFPCPVAELLSAAE